MLCLYCQQWSWLLKLTVMETLSEYIADVKDPIKIVKLACKFMTDEYKVLTVKNVYDEISHAFSFNDLPLIAEHLQYLSTEQWRKYNTTKVNGYLELHPIKQAKLSDLLSK